MFKTFHLCEAPGCFIKAIEYYIKKKTTIKNFEWYAQSLNPSNETNISIFSEIIGDNYNIIKNNPDKWIFGEKNTGDITDINNINYYINFFFNNKRHIITSDCGLSNDNDSGYDLFHVYYCQFFTSLKCLKKHGSFISKIFLPCIEPIKISVIYTLYLHFKYIIFFKGIINPNSKEFYIIAYNYNDDITENEYKKMKIYLNKNTFDNDIHIYGDMYDYTFLMLLNDGIKMLSENFIFVIKRQIYLVDNYKLIDDNKFFEYLKFKNQEWIKDNKLLKNI